MSLLALPTLLRGRPFEVEPSFGFCVALADIACRRYWFPAEILFEVSWQDRQPFFSLEGLSNSFREVYSESVVYVKRVIWENWFDREKG